MMRFVTQFIYVFLLIGGKFCLSANELDGNGYDPANLYLGWWSNFEDTPENQGHIDKLIQELKELKGSLDTQKHPLMEIQIDQVILSAEQVVKSRTEKMDYKQIHPLYLSKYSIDELLEISQNIRSLENEKGQSEQQVRSIRQNINRMRNELDYLQIEYPLKDEESFEKLKIGLQIMNLRFMIEENELRIDQLKKRANLQDDNLAKLKKELNVAEERLDLSSLNKEEIKKNIRTAEALLIEANRALLQARMHSQPDSSEEIAATVKVLQIKAQRLLEKVQLLFLELGHHQRKDAILKELAEVNELQKLLNTSNDYLKTQMKSVQSSENQSTFLSLQNKLSNIKLLTSLLSDKAIEEQTSFTQRLYWIYYKGIEILNQLLSYSSVSLFRINDYSVTLWALFRACCILLGSIFLSRIVFEFLKNFDRLNLKIGNANTYILAKIFYYLSIALGILIALYSIGFSIGNFIIVAGVLGVGVGLGLQSIANNFFSGLVVLFSKILKVGDVVETSTGLRGYVKSIKMQNIHIRTYDGKDVILPNADLVTKNVINWTMVDPFIRLHIPFSVEYGADKELVEKIVIDIAESLEYTVKNESICPRPAVWLRSLGDNGLHLELVLWVNIKKHTSVGNLETVYLWEIERELLKNGISIPYPKREIHIVKESE